MKWTFLTAALLMAGGVAAQQVNINQHFKNWKPRNIGPAGMSGRITAIDAVHSNPNIIFLGAASGGVWKTTNGGNEWTPVFDEQPLLNIGSIAIQQSNPAVVWAGTGEGNPRNSLNIGEGIYKSMDGGKSWKKMGLDKTRNIHRIIIDPTNPQVVYAAAIGNPYGEHPERGVFKTTDGGETWSKILYANDTTGCGELVMDPSNPNKLIAALWQHRRQPWVFKSGGPGSGLYITYDGGKNWKKLDKENGMPEGNIGRIGLSFSRSMPSRVYAKIESSKNGFYRSDDGGLNWSLVNAGPEVTDRPFYFQEIYVDPANENRIYDIHSTVTLTEDGGKSFSTLIPYSGVHPDHHAWWINPKDPNFIIDGNDGGIAVSHDRGKTWQFDEKLPIGQFYHINVDNQIPYNVMGGMQDNGSWHGPAYTWTNGGIRNYYWANVGGGDGFDVMADPDDPNWIYSMSQGGYLGKSNIKTAESWFLRPGVTDPKVKLRYNWNSAMAQDPTDSKTIYYGSQFLFKSTNKGATWEVVSPDLTTNNPEQQKQNENGGLTLDITGAETYNTILAIAPSPKQAGVIWVGTDDGNVQLTTDGGKTWTNFRGKIPGMPTGAWVPQIRASNYNAGEAFVVTNDYRRGDFKPYIFRTTDFGKTWTRLADDTKVKGYALTMIQDPVEPNLIFVGTEHGLWVSMDNGASFQQWKNGYPAVSTYDFAIQEREADLAIATFGRSLWILDDIRPLRALAAKKGQLSKLLTVFPAPEAYKANYRPAMGYEWSLAGLYDASNRPYGAAISFLINKTKKPADTTKKTLSDTVYVKIYDQQRNQIRSLRWNVDSGFQRQYWYMEEKGYRFPGSPKPKPDADEPGGDEALAGTYKVLLTYNGESDSTMIVVKDDPRIGNKNEAKLAQRALAKRLRASGDKLIAITDRFNEAEEIINKVNASLDKIEGKEADSLRNSAKPILDSIKVLREKISGKKVDKQGLSASLDPTIQSRYYEAYNYIGARLLAPGSFETALVENSEKEIAELAKTVNGFFDTKWKAYQSLVESTKISLFKSWKAIE